MYIYQNCHHEPPNTTTLLMITPDYHKVDKYKCTMSKIPTICKKINYYFLVSVGT